MSRNVSRFLLSALVVCAVAFFSAAYAQPGGRFLAPPSGPNLAVVATPSAKYVSADTRLSALNDGQTPRRGRANPREAYGNWPQGNATQWVQYDWRQPISTSRIEVLWWSDNNGVRAPKACRLLYWDGAKFVPVANPQGLGVSLNQFNITNFAEVKTDRLRLEIDGDGNSSTGILEWRVIDSGKSPKFPPAVVAGPDRDVMADGKTYLNGKANAINGNSATYAWSKASGPGEVSFENAAALATTAKFSALGDYVLKLTASQGKLSTSSTLQVKVVAPPPAVQLDAVNTRTFKVNNPLWNNRVKALIVGWIPHCIDYCNNSSLPQGGMDNFIEAGKALRGEPHGRHKGFPFSNAWVHQTVEAMSIALMVDPQGDPDIIKAQAKMRATLEDWIPKILAAQEPDGYLQTRFTLNGGNHWDPRTRGEHEGYVAGYFLESAINHYMMTGRKDARLYNAAKKLADCWYNNLGPAPKKTWYDGHQEMEQALVRFGRFVNDMEGPGKGQKYIDLAKFLLNSRTGGSEYDQSHLPVIQQYEVTGHAVRAMYTYSGMSDVAKETHDVDYQSAVMSLWDNLVNRKYYVTGGVGSAVYGDEGFGPNFDLPNNSYCESCSTCGELFFQYKMNLAYQDAKYVDLYEDALYNALLGSIDLKGENFCYTNSLLGTEPRTPWHNCPCCVGNIPRTLLMLPTWMYAKGKDSIYVNLFIGSTATIEDVAGMNVEMVQATDYPWSGKIAITVNPEKTREFTVKVRIPTRGVSTLYSATPEVKGLLSLKVNGESMTPRMEKGYAVLTRTWKAGDKIELDLPLEVQRVKASEKVTADAGRVALRYGPLIYNVERADQDINTKVLSPTAPLKAEWRPDFLGGVTVIKGVWADGSPLLAVPNYVRNNRPVPSAAGQVQPPAGGRGRGMRLAGSIVWMKDKE